MTYPSSSQIGGIAKCLLLALALLAGSAAPAVANVAPDESRAYYDAAVQHVAQGKLRAAVVELKNALQRDPANAEARLLLGEVYLGLGDPAAAEKELRVAGRHGVEAARIVVSLGRALLMQRRFDQLLAELSETSHDPTTVLEIQLLRADAHGGLGQLDQARSILESAAEDHPEEARIHLGIARLELVAGNFAAAEDQASAALARQAGLVEASLLLAEARRLNGDAAAALEPFRAVLDGERVPSDARVRAHLGLAAALIALERDEEAEVELAGARTLAPDVPLASYLHAMIKVRRNDFAAARQLLDAAAPSLEGFAPAQFLSGVVYYAAGELETARSWLVRHLRSQPENLQAQKLLAATLLRLNAIQDAVRLLEPALSRVPDDPQILLLLGNAYIRSGRPAEASSLLQRAADLAPQDPRVLGQLAISHLATGHREEALSALTATLDLGADASAIGYALAFAHLRAGAFEDALKVATDLRERYPESAVAANLEGGAHAALGQLDEARASFEAVLAIEPNYHEARANLAALKAQTGNFDEAEADYLAILEAEESNPTALMGMAALSHHRNDSAATQRWLVSAVKADPDGLKPSLALAEHHLATGDLPAAVAALESLAERQPRDPQVLLALGRVQSRAGAPAAAVRSYQRLVEASGGSAAARLLLAEAQLMAGELEASRVSYEALREDQAENPIVWNNLAWLYQQEGDDRAAAHGERALELAPNQPAVMDTLGWILLEDGEVDRATELLERAHQSAPASGDIAYHYASALHRSGDNRAARELLQSLLQSGQAFAAQAEATALLEKLSP